MKKRSVLDGIGNIKIYTGPIHKIYADDFTLVRGRPVCTKKDVIIQRRANFYIGDGAGGSYENIENGCVLPSREEAIKNCDQSVSTNKAKLIGVLSGKISDPKEAHRILDTVKAESESLYYIPSELKYEQDMPKKKVKEYVKKAEEARNKNKK